MILNKPTGMSLRYMLSCWIVGYCGIMWGIVGCWVVVWVFVSCRLDVEVGFYG